MREDGRIGVHVVEHRAVDADGSIGARVVGVTRIEVIRQLPPVPDRSARVATFDAAIEVVPVVEQAHFHARHIAQVELRERLPGLHQAQQAECAVQHAEVRVADDRGRGVAIHRDAADHVAVVAERAGIEVQFRQQWRGSRRAGDDGAVHAGFVPQRRCPPQQAGKPAQQFGARRSPRRCCDIHHQLRGMRAVCLRPRCRQRLIAQPQVVTVLCVNRGCRQSHDHSQQCR